MKTSELNYIKEITGLTTEAEVKTSANPTKAQSVTTKVDSREDKTLLVFVGKPARVGKRYGVIDEVCSYGLGFVSGSASEWRGSVENPAEVELLSDPAEVRRAIESAQWYFSNEIESLSGRIKMNLANDNKERLQAHLNHCLTWSKKLA